MEYVLLALMLTREPNYSFDQTFIARFETPQACNAALIDKISVDNNSDTEYECRLVNAKGEIQPREATGPVKIVTGWDKTRQPPNQIIEFRGLNDGNRVFPIPVPGVRVGPF